MKTIAHIIILYLVIGGTVFAQQKVPAEAHKTAEMGLSQMAEVVSKTDYKALGIESPEQLKKAQLGTPVQEFMIRLDALQEYNKTIAPLKLLSGGDEYTYPVIVDKKVITSITIAKVKDQWTVVSFGSPNKIGLVDHTRRLYISEATPESSYFFIKVPALYYYFLGHIENGQLQMIPIMNYPELDIKAAVIISTQQVLESMSRAAKEYKFPADKDR